MLITRLIVSVAATYGIQKASEKVAEVAVKKYFELGGVTGIKTKLKEFKDSFDSKKNSDQMFEELAKVVDEVMQQQKLEGREWTEEEITEYAKTVVTPRYITPMDRTILDMRISIYASIKNGVNFKIVENKGE
jgi:hypothetical protein